MPDIFALLKTLGNEDITRYSDSEVLTPQNIVSDMVDLLPQDIFNPHTTFLDPAVKSGRFLKEIYNRLFDSSSLKAAFPDEQLRRDHILHNQLYGLATSTLSATLSRAMLYDTAVYRGNIVYIDNYINKMADKKTDYSKLIKGAFGDMKFDVAIGNPPYQKTNGGGIGMGAISMYEKFIELALDLNTKYISMITKSSWFNGLNYEKFRQKFLKGKHLVSIDDYINSNEVFPNMNGIAGGVSYFLWEKSYTGSCKFTRHVGDKTEQSNMDFEPNEIIIRYPTLASVVSKVKAHGEETMQSYISAQSPFGFITSAVDSANATATEHYNIKLIGSRGREGWVSKDEVTRGKTSIDKYKLLISKAAGDSSGKTDKKGMFSVLSAPFIIKPQEVCTQSYLVAGISANEQLLKNCSTYLKTKFVRALILRGCKKSCVFGVINPLWNESDM